MSIDFNVNSTKKSAKDIYVSINGTKRKIVKVLTCVNGALKIIFDNSSPTIENAYLFMGYDYAVSKDSLMLTTDNFVTYTNLLQTSISKVAYKDGTFFAFYFGASSKVYKSTDLTTWTETAISIDGPSVPSSYVSELLIDGGKFIFVSELHTYSGSYSHKFYYWESSDGINWKNWLTNINSLLPMQTSVSSTYQVVRGVAVMKNSAKRCLVVKCNRQRTSSTANDYRSAIVYCDLDNVPSSTDSTFTFTSLYNSGDSSSAGGSLIARYTDTLTYISRESGKLLELQSDGNFSFSTKTYTIYNYTYSSVRNGNLQYSVYSNSENKIYVFNLEDGTYEIYTISVEGTNIKGMVLFSDEVNGGVYIVSYTTGYVLHMTSSGVVTVIYHSTTGKLLISPSSNTTNNHIYIGG